MSAQEKVQKTFCTTREAAKLLGVSLRTAQLWSESGLLEAWKTAGGHRRITRDSIECLLSLPSKDVLLGASAAAESATGLHSAPEFSGMTIVVVSGLDADEISRRGNVPEGIPILSKPIPFGRLEGIATELIEARRKAQAKAAK
jgi:excisionase family DNA binding protein